MKKIKTRTIKSLKVKIPDKEKQIDLWMYGYYSCSSLFMSTTIDLSENNNKQ